MPTITLDQINNHKVTPVKVKTDPRPVKGAELFPDLYGSLFMVAHTDMGKTTVIYNLVPKIIGKKTKVIIFASTAYNDDVWIALRRKLERMGNEVEVFTSLRDKEGNHIKDLVEDLEEEAKAREEAGENEEEEHQPTTDELLKELRKQNGIHEYMEKYDPEMDKPKKEKHQTPEYLLIFDDMSKELRTPEITVLLKECRHFHIRCIVSSQGLKDLMPSAKQQVKGWMIFKGFPEQTLFDLHHDIGLKLPFDVFYDLYKESSNETKDNPKNFFYFLPRRFDFRRNLDHRWNIPKIVYDSV